MTAEELAFTKRWVETWKETGEELERIRWRELRGKDTYRAIELLCGPADYAVSPRASNPTSGLVEMQYWLRKAAGRE